MSVSQHLHAITMTESAFLMIICYLTYFTTGAYFETSDHLLDRNLIILPAEDNFPKFVLPVQNTTVTVGHNALLACIVDNLQNYKVTWLNLSTHTILTSHQSIITKDSRISLSYNDHRSWYLHLRDVRQEDRGWYACQINTDPITSQTMYLQVLVPPKILLDETSNDIVAREMSDIVLQCKATGYPEPFVMWRRADGNDFTYNGEKVNVVDGERLHFNKISRLHIGTYYCIAQNGIPPVVNKKITLTVHFPPILHVPNQLVGATLNQKVTLLCTSEAYPKSINYWTKGNGEMILPGEKHEIIYKHDLYTTNMMLTIHRVCADDYGTYTCVSINPLGNTDGIIKLYEVTPPVEYEWKSSMTTFDNETEVNEGADNEIIFKNNNTSAANNYRLQTLTFSSIYFIYRVHQFIS